MGTQCVLLHVWNSREYPENDGLHLGAVMTENCNMRLLVGTPKLHYMTMKTGRFPKPTVAVFDFTEKWNGYISSDSAILRHYAQQITLVAICYDICLRSAFSGAWTLRALSRFWSFRACETPARGVYVRCARVLAKCDVKLARVSLHGQMRDIETLTTDKSIKTNENLNHAYKNMLFTN